MKGEITVLMVKPMERPIMVTIKNNLESLQKAVGGLIEIIDIENNVCIICNEEGKLIGLQGNRKLYNDIIVETFYVCGYDNKGNLTSLDSTSIRKYTDLFWKTEEYTREQIENSIICEFICCDEDNK